jgi:hypothetical protein
MGRHGVLPDHLVKPGEERYGGSPLSKPRPVSSSEEAYAWGNKFQAHNRLSEDLIAVEKFKFAQIASAAEPRPGRCVFGGCCGRHERPPDKIQFGAPVASPGTLIWPVPSPAQDLAVVKTEEATVRRELLQTVDAKPLHEPGPLSSQRDPALVAAGRLKSVRVANQEFLRRPKALPGSTPPKSASPFPKKAPPLEPGHSGWNGTQDFGRKVATRLAVMDGTPDKLTAPQTRLHR